MKRDMLAGKTRRIGTPGKPLSARAVNLTLTVTGMALRAAVKCGVVARNVAELVERVPSDADNSGRGAWQTEDAVAFLRSVRGERLYAAWLLSMLGLRRGEVLGLRWSDVDLDAGLLTVRKQLAQIGWRVELADVKTDSSEAPVALDTHTVQILRAHRANQHKQRLASGPGWNDTDLVFTKPNGQQLHPAEVTDRFLELATQAGLPPIRLHDLRHGAATLALAAGADLKTVQALLGHASIVLTADTYTSVLPELLANSAEATARLVLAHAAASRADAPAAESRAGPKSATPAPTRQPDPSGRSDPASDGTGGRAAHVRPTHVPQRSRPHSHEAIRPGQNGCAARDSNPEPAD
jgi:integrase